MTCSHSLSQFAGNGRGVRDRLARRATRGPLFGLSRFAADAGHYPGGSDGAPVQDRAIRPPSRRASRTPHPRAGRCPARADRCSDRIGTRCRRGVGARLPGTGARDHGRARGRSRRRGKRPAHLLRRPRRQRRVEDDERRDDVGSRVRRPADGFGRRRQCRALQPQPRLGRDGRTGEPPEFALGRRRLQVDGCGRDLDPRGTRGHPPHQQNQDRSARSRCCVRGGRRPPLGSERGARPL